MLHRKDRSPGQRYRHEQYIQHLEAAGFECEFSPMLSEKDDRIFYAPGHYFQKVIIGLKCLFRRLKDVRKAKHYEFTYIYRDAFFFGTFIEGRIKKSGTKIIYDFDDAIWLEDLNPNQGIFNKLKTPGKVSKLIELSHRTIVGNEYLASYARLFNQNISIIPSTVDFDKYVSLQSPNSDSICIGWTGSFSTLKHFESVIEALEGIHQQFKEKVIFKVIGVPEYQTDKIPIQSIPWSSESEVEDLAELDIGIMPLPDNEWTRGKCAMKGLQYMALGIPTIMSPVGINKEIIHEGENGMLAESTDEWVEKLSLLIEDSALREKLGKSGKQTVFENFSVQANKDKWLEAFS